MNRLKPVGGMYVQIKKSPGICRRNLSSNTELPKKVWGLKPLAFLRNPMTQAPNFFASKLTQGLYGSG